MNWLDVFLIPIRAVMQEESGTAKIITGPFRACRRAISSVLPGKQPKPKVSITKVKSTKKKK